VEAQDTGFLALLSNVCCSIKAMPEFVKFLSLLNPLELCSVYFTSCLFWPWHINNDPTISLDGARPPPKCVLNNK
jgi:hypothetical protein